MIEYRGYVGVFEYDPDDELFRGRVVNLGKDGITFAGTSVEELKRELAASVDDYLAWCAERGESPEKPFNGTFLVRSTPELHRAAFIAAARSQKSLNAWVVETLREAAERSG
ncbi:MAG TPA: type II toxin-antitoxin system HicB family antitoxin [Longimicrobiaceae bacterium]